MPSIFPKVSLEMVLLSLRRQVAPVVLFERQPDMPAHRLERFLDILPDKGSPQSWVPIDNYLPGP